MTKTLRLLAPDWQAGDQPLYYLGAELLSKLVPKRADQIEIRLPIAQPTEDPQPRVNRVTAQPVVQHNVELAQRVLTEHQPDRVLTLGGNCLVSQAPFDYLHQRYGERLGVIWIDAHPDISTPAIFPNEHAMVLGNLLGHGDPALARLVQAPFDPAAVKYVGLQQPTTDERPLLAALGLDYQAEEPIDHSAIQAWIDAHHFTKLAVHLDLDVLDPRSFRSQYFAEPGRTTFPSASGTASSSAVTKLLQSLNAHNEVVGLTLAEYLPWDALTLQRMLAPFSSF